MAASTEKMTQTDQAIVEVMNGRSGKPKLTGREFYNSIGRPKYIVAPMVDRSEFAWRMLTRSYMDGEESKRLLAYSPMFHARLFGERAGVRDDYFQPIRASLTTKEAPDAERYLDGNPQIDRPLFVQFCANKPNELLEAAQYVAPYCDAVDLNLGCPQGIARAGKYGAFLQEDWDTISKMISTLHKDLSVPITAKMRILETKEKTLEYAKMILSAGASILTVHGRRREQKGHNTGVADWTYIRYLRDNLPPETVLFANGNILNHSDLEQCLEATGADGIMSAEGNLSDPTIFASPPSDPESREYWRDDEGRGGYRIDGVFRRYMDIIYKYLLEKDAPQRPPLYIPTDSESNFSSISTEADDDGQPPRKKRRGNDNTKYSPSLKFMQGHLFALLKPMLAIHTDIRDTLAKTRAGDIQGFEKVLKMVEQATQKGLKEEYDNKLKKQTSDTADTTQVNEKSNENEPLTGSAKTAAEYWRPWFVCQPRIRPLPEEAIKIGAMTVSKKDRARIETEAEATVTQGKDIQRSDTDDKPASAQDPSDSREKNSETPAAALVCG